MTDSAIKHGTISGYRHLRCRCDECRRANSEYMAVYRAGTRGEDIPPSEYLSDLLHELAPYGLTDECPARRNRKMAA